MLPLEYTISTDKSRLDLSAIHAFLSTSYWSPGIPVTVVAKAIENSLVFGLYYREKQVGFARVVTDKASFAYLADVYVLDAHRGKALGKSLVATVLAHEDLQGLRRFLLATKDAHRLYRQFGFNALADPMRMMERRNPNVYTTPSSVAAD